MYMNVLYLKQILYYWGSAFSWLAKCDESVTEKRLDYNIVKMSQEFRYPTQKLRKTNLKFCFVILLSSSLSHVTKKP